MTEERFQEEGDKGLGPGLREKLAERAQDDGGVSVSESATARVLELLEGSEDRLTAEDVNAVVVPLMAASLNRLSDAVMYCYAVQEGADCPLYGEALRSIEDSLPELMAARKLLRHVTSSLREEGALPDFRPPSEDDAPPATSEDPEEG